MIANDSALLTSIQWLATLATGSIATAIGIIAVAVFGIGLLVGIIDLKRGLNIILGLLIVFGAPTIANGLRQLDVGPIDHATGLAPDYSTNASPDLSEPNTSSAYPKTVCWTCDSRLLEH